MNRCRVARRVVSSRLPQNPWNFARFHSTSATKLFRRNASKGTIPGPGFGTLGGDGGGGPQYRDSVGGGMGVWLLARCLPECRVALALMTLRPLFSHFAWSTKGSSVREAR